MGINDGDIVFSSVEQGLQYAKTFFSGAPADVVEPLRREMLGTSDASRLRELGSRIPSFESERWESVRKEFMTEMFRAAFEANPGDLRALKDTGEARLVCAPESSEWADLLPSVLSLLRETLPLPAKEEEKVAESRQSELYVSYYGSTTLPKDSFKVVISTSTPKGFKGEATLDAAIPSWQDMVAPYKNGLIVDAVYSRRYMEQLKSRRESICRRVDELRKQADGRDIYFLCYERPGAFCHRYLFNNFLNENGIACSESREDRMQYRTGRVPLFGEGKEEREAGPAVNVEDAARREMVFVSYTESKYGYAGRTRENANAPGVDFTAAFGVDFTTAGESCTAKAAGGSLVRVPFPMTPDGRLDLSQSGIESAVKVFRDEIPEEFWQGTPSGWNIAGNGQYTLDEYGISQRECDLFVCAVFKELSELGIRPSLFRSGGQTGVDESAGVVGEVLEVPTEIHAPSGWEFRVTGESGKPKDITGNRDAFVARFESKPIEAYRKVVDGLIAGMGHGAATEERKASGQLKLF